MKTPSKSIKIRERKLKNGEVSLYLDIYLGNGKREYESLDIKYNSKDLMSLTYGTDLYTVSKLLGHRDIATTQVYAKIIDEKKKEAVNKLPKMSTINK
jgi:integrase